MAIIKYAGWQDESTTLYTGAELRSSTLQSNPAQACAVLCTEHCSSAPVYNVVKKGCLKVTYSNRQRADKTAVLPSSAHQLRAQYMQDTCQDSHCQSYCEQQEYIDKIYFLLLFNRLFSVYKLTRRPRFGRRIFYRPDTLPDTQPTSPKHYKAKIHFKNEIHK